VKEDSKVAKFADLKKLKVGVQTGTTGDEAVSKLLGKTSTNIKRFESTPLALKELEAGGVDAVVADNGVVVHYVANNPGGKFKTVSDTEFVPEQYGIALKKGNAELLAKVNKGLAASRPTAPTTRSTPSTSARRRRRGSGAAPAPRCKVNAPPSEKPADGSSLGDPRRLRAAVRQRPVMTLSSRWWPSAPGWCWAWCSGWSAPRPTRRPPRPPPGGPEGCWRAAWRRPT
jgi:hypothetical protein